MSNTTLVIPVPNARYAFVVENLDGGQPILVPVTIGAGNALDTSNALLVGGLGTTTAGVTGVGDNLFVSAQELSDLITLQPLAVLEAALAIVANLSPVETTLLAIGGLTGAETLLASAAGVDLNTDTPPTLFTVPTGKSAIVTRFVVRLASHTLDTVSFSMGYESATFANVVANGQLTALTGNTLFAVVAAKAGATVGTTGQVLKLKNNTKNGTATTVTIETLGYLF